MALMNRFFFVNQKYTLQPVSPESQTNGFMNQFFFMIQIYILQPV